MCLLYSHASSAFVCCGAVSAVKALFDGCNETALADVPVTISQWSVRGGEARQRQLSAVLELLLPVFAYDSRCRGEKVAAVHGGRA